MPTKQEYETFLKKYKLSTGDVIRITGKTGCTIGKYKSKTKNRIVIQEDTWRLLRVAVGELKPDFWKVGALS